MKARYNLLDGGSSNKKPYDKMIVLATICFTIALVCIFTQDTQKSDDVENKGKLTEEVAKTEQDYSYIFEAFRDCVRPKIEHLRGNYDQFWHSFANLTKECDNLPAYEAFDIRSAQNTDEVKYVAYPKKMEPLTMVTLGIGHDVSAELKLKELYPNTDFFGADPSSDINKDLYENKLGGKYYEYAISGERGMQKSRVYEKNGYREEITKHIGADFFFKDVLQKNKIDILWMDIEGNEYPIMDQLHQNGVLDNEGVKICQMNVEMHKDTFKQSVGETRKFHDFVWKILDDKKYIMMKPFYVIYRSRRFIRTFIVNVADKECTDLYLS
ncbi:hypothetical protein GCK72_018289 [Caenorhabditis remanei]|uniref:Methyltransferase FkbM domain-containing protein n=1 Tax=Caenorhabditis remanei TaxID=31234 RepID=A0A6A5GAS4_CAERE|nr:hypothetical protein GCK72_018289 [Caenorhabditis remanei]KAF1751735.1 hypothetical protein GCK72_018289 [Caenorhabditis remanei]